MAHPVIYALHGYMGSGKTSYGQTLACQLPALLLSSDEWMVQLYGQDPPEEVFRPGVLRVKALMRSQAERVLTLGLNVILDDGFWTRASRDGLRTWAARLGFSLALLSFAVPEAEALRRIEFRNRQPGVLFVAEETYRLFQPSFEPLAPDEAYTEVGIQMGWTADGPCQNG